MDFIASQIDGGVTMPVLRNAMAYGTAVASFNVERFGTEGVEAVDGGAVRARVDDLYAFAHFEPIDVALKG